MVCIINLEVSSNAALEGSRDASVNDITEDIANSLLNGLSNSSVQVLVGVTNPLGVEAGVVAVAVVLVVEDGGLSAIDWFAVAATEVIGHIVLVVVGITGSSTTEVVNV